MAKKEVKGSRKQDDSKLFAFLGVFLTVIGFVIAIVARKNDKYVMYYGKQGLVLFIAWIVVMIVSAILFFVPFISTILWLCWVILWVFGIIYSLSGSMRPVPLIGQFADKINV